MEALSAGLEPASVRSRALGELRNAALTAKLVTTAALFRRESRGAHFRADFPVTDESWRRRISFSMDRAGRLRAQEDILEPAAAGAAR